MAGHVHLDLEPTLNKERRQMQFLKKMFVRVATKGVKVKTSVKGGRGEAS
jgi:hypothetical protein